MTAVSCGIDWAQDHHDVAVVDQHGAVVCAERIGNDAAGLARLLEILAEHDPTDRRLEVAIETSRGLLVAGLRAAGRTVFAINPLAVSRYRDRYRCSRGKSDAFDAMVLANILRTDRDAHRPLPDDTEQVRALQVLCRAQQDAVWDKITVTNRIRALLKAYFPAAVAAFERGGKHRLESPSCRTILTTAPTPREGVRADRATPRSPAAQGRSPARHRRRSRPAARLLPHRADAPAQSGRAGHGRGVARAGAPARRDWRRPRRA